MASWTQEVQFVKADPGLTSAQVRSLCLLVLSSFSGSQRLSGSSEASIHLMWKRGRQVELSCLGVLELRTGMGES